MAAFKIEPEKFQLRNRRTTDGQRCSVGGQQLALLVQVSLGAQMIQA
jgi:hypothetical protein